MEEDKVFLTERIGNVLIILPQRNIGSMSDEKVESESESVLEHLLLSGIRHVVMDFSQTSYFGSTMLAQMVTIWRRLHEIEGVLAVCGLSHVGREIIQTANFDNLFGIYETQEEALAAFRAKDREPSA